MRNPGSETNPTPPETKPAPETRLAKDDSIKQPPDTYKNSGGGVQDPKAISESLRRIRTSGPLIIEAIKQNSDRVNEIIAQSIQGLNESRPEAKAPPPPPAPPLQKGKKRSAIANRESRPQTARPAIARPAIARQNNQMALQAKTPTSAKTPTQSAQSVVQSVVQTGANTVAAAVAATQSVTRRTAGFLSGSAANRSVSHAATNGSHNGPSTVLVQASGFKPQSGFGPKVLIGGITILVLLAAGIYFPFRDKLLTQNHPAEGASNLVSPQDISADLVKFGQADRAQGKYDSAAEHFHRALDLAPNNPDIRYLLAETYLADGRTDSALRGYQEILRIAPEHLDARFQLAKIYQGRGYWSAAYKEYQNIIELNQNSPQAAKALEAIEEQRDAMQAEAPVARNSKRGQRQPRPDAPALPGVAIRAQVPLMPQMTAEVPGINPPAVLSDARSDEKPDPRAVAYSHRRLGERYFNVRQFRAAINEFLRALDLNPGDKDDLYYFIGSSYHGMGLPAEAYDYYKRVASGPYAGPAKSGAKQTEKAAREAAKRREPLKFQTLKNEQKAEPVNDNPGKPNKSLMSRILDSLK